MDGWMEGKSYKQAQIDGLIETPVFRFRQEF